MSNTFKKLFSLSWMVLVLAFCAQAASSTADAGDDYAPDKKSAELWNKYIKDKPDLILDNWGLVNGLRLYHQAGKLDNRLAVFATVAFASRYRVSIGDFALTEKKFIILAQNLKGSALTDDEKDKVKNLFEEARKKYGDRTTPMQYGTFSMGQALKLGLTVNASSWLSAVKAKFGIGDPESFEPSDWFERAVKRIAKYHGWTATVEKGGNTPFDKYRKSIDRHVPVIIERDGYYKLVVGYLVADNVDYILTADLAKTPLEKTGMTYTPSEKEHFESLPPDNPWRKMYEGNRRNKRFVTDLRLRSAMPLHPGFLFEPFEKGKYRAYFIHGWHKSLDAWKPEIRKILKLDKKGKEN